MIGDYFAENYTKENTYTSYNKFKTFLTNPRNPGAPPAEVEFTVGYIYEHPGHWKDNSGFLSDVNHLQDNYYYQPYSYVVQTFNTPYEIWKSLYNQSAHPAGFKVFGELLVQHSIQFTPVTFESKQIYFEFFDDKVTTLDTISIDFFKVIDEQYTESDPDYFAENYINNNLAHVTDETTINLALAPFEETVVSSDATSWELSTTANDNYIISDSTETATNFLRDVSDAVAIIDNGVAIGSTFDRSFSDTITVADSVDVVRFIGKDETAITSDVLSYTINKGTITDTVTPVDANSKQVDKFIDGIDVYSSQQYFAEDYVSDNVVSISDAVTITAEPNPSDVVNTTDAILSVQYSKILADTIISSDTLILDIDERHDAQSSLSELTSAIDVKTINVNTIKTESVSSSDVVVQLVEKSFSENITQNDVISKVTGTNISELVVTSDDITSKDVNKNITEDVTILETVAKTLPKEFSDTITLSDNVLTSLSREVSASDTVNLSDQVTEFIISKSVSETIITSDALTKFINELDDAQSDLSDTSSISESLAVSLSIEKSDTSTISDALSITENISKTDSVTLSDASEVAVAKATFTETVTSSDSNTKLFSLVIDDSYTNENYFDCNYSNENKVYTQDSVAVVVNGYVASEYVTDGYATDNFTINDTPSC